MKVRSSIRFLLLWLLLLGMLPQNATESYSQGPYVMDAEYLAYRAKVDTIDNSGLRNTPQYHRTKGSSHQGICNLCSMETLLNRKAAYDWGDYSCPFTDEKMFAACGVKDLGNGPKKEGQRLVYDLSGSVGSSQSNSYSYTNETRYKSVLLGNSSVNQLMKATGKTGQEAQYEAISKLLLEHPEGIWIRAEYNTHAIVITDFEIIDGTIRLYGIDPVDVRDEQEGRTAIENLNFYETNYKNGAISTKNALGQYKINIAYLEIDGKTPPPMTIDVPQLQTPAPVGDIRVSVSEDNTVTIGWSEIPGADSYDLQIYSSDQNSLTHESYGLQNTQFTIKGLLSGCGYRFLVRAGNEYGFTEWVEQSYTHISPTAGLTQLPGGKTADSAYVGIWTIDNNSFNADPIMTFGTMYRMSVWQTQLRPDGTMTYGISWHRGEGTWQEINGVIQGDFYSPDECSTFHIELYPQEENGTIYLQDGYPDAGLSFRWRAS